jgi:esterase/lipase superfamily enzyme
LNEESLPVIKSAPPPWTLPRAAALADKAGFGAMMFIRWFLTALILLYLAGCASRPGPDVLRSLTSPVAVSGAKQIKIYVATTRERSADGENVFTNGRATHMNFAEFTISVPPNHKTGMIEWPTAKPDPKTSFVTVSQRILDRASFEREINRDNGGKKTDAALFVHGYNTNFQEALFRLAQLSAEGRSSTIPILFAWPSDGAVAGYVADKDAAIYSRDGLVDVMTMIGRNGHFSEILVAGHSMGGWLTMEALRQLKLTGQKAVLDKLKVVLAAPDIDVDVFRAQLTLIGPMRQPMTILVSTDDRALAVSRLLSGERQRLGSLDIKDPEVQATAKMAHVQIVDISEVAPDDPFKHNRFSSLASLSTKAPDQGHNAAAVDLRSPGVFIYNAARATLTSPFVLANRIAGRQR